MRSDAQTRVLSLGSLHPLALRCHCGPLKTTHFVIARPVYARERVESVHAWYTCVNGYEESGKREAGSEASINEATLNNHAVISLIIRREPIFQPSVMLDTLSLASMRFSRRVNELLRPFALSNISFVFFFFNQISKSLHGIRIFRIGFFITKMFWTRW